MFIGQTYEKEMGLFIKDQDGKPRIKIFIDKNKQPRIQLLNADGTVVR
ncbi:hypothetical protein [Niabella drilacis]|nr:hypothetical protein [Niabella drilacis]